MLVFISAFNFKEILSVSLVLFSVIDIFGSIPIIIDLKKKAGGYIQSGKATYVAGILMVAFLFIGESILHLFGLDVSSFAIAGAIIIFLLGMEMVLGVSIFKEDESLARSASVVPIAFPLIAGAGTMTTILTLKASYATINILIGILLNLLLVYAVLKASNWIEQKIGRGGEAILRKVFGIILLAISIKIFQTNLVPDLSH
ncbi:MAG: MarC family protein [Aureispira sp.]